MILPDFTVVYQILLFLVLWAVLSKLLFRPYLGLLEERERRTTGAAGETAELELEANRLKMAYEEQIAKAQAAGSASKEAILSDARQQREALLGRAREDATSSLQQVREEVQRQLDRERQLAVTEATNLAGDMARKILGRNVA
jgi:F-type H+-transporting ATPase subunit b